MEPELKKEHTVTCWTGRFKPIKVDGQAWTIEFKSPEALDIIEVEDNIKKLSKLANHFKECED